jgi:hypothetical protein
LQDCRIAELQEGKDGRVQGNKFLKDSSQGGRKERIQGSRRPKSLNYFDPSILPALNPSSLLILHHPSFDPFDFSFLQFCNPAILQLI